jgi:chitinase
LGGTAYARAGLPDNWYGAAPYVTPLDNDPPSLPEVMAATGQKSFTMASVRGSGGGCEPTWDGTRPVSADTAVGGMIDAVRQAGGDAVLSFGGPRGSKLGDTCGSAQATADAYQRVIDRYAARAVDFDIEPSGYSGPAGTANEVGAARILQRRNPDLHISITVPGTSGGAGWFGQQVLNQAKSIAFAPDSYSVSTVDGGFTDAASLVGGLESFHGMLMTTFGWDATTAYAREGFAGVNGGPGAGGTLGLPDFQAVLDYVTSHKMGRYTFSSVNRDRPCGASTGAGACGQAAQNPWDFTALTARFGNATTPTAGASGPAEPPAPASPALPPPASAPPVTTSPATPPPALPPVRPPGTAPNTLAARSGGSYEAEAGTLSGRAVVFSCSGCSGRKKVGRLGNDTGTLTFDGITAGQAGSYALTIAYVDADSGRSAVLTVNGRSTVVGFHGTGDGDWNTVQTLTVSVPLNAGSNTVTFSNPSGDAPDIDRISY